MKYSFRKGVQKVAWVFFLFLVPQAVDWFVVAYPEVAQLSIGAGLYFLSNLLKNWAKIRLP